MASVPARRPRVPFHLYRIATRLKRLVDRACASFANAMLERYFGAGGAGGVSYRAFRSLDSDSDVRWAAKAAEPGRLTIVAVTYRQPDPLGCFLASLRCQTLQNFDLIVLHDGVDPETRRVVEAHRALASAPCRYIETDVRHNDYGHTLRALGLAEASGEFVLITNGDNYYAPRLVEFAFEAVDREALDLVLWNMVHSHQNAGNTGSPSYLPFDCYPFWNRIDIGSFFVRTELARAVGFTARHHDADASYVQQLLEASPAGLRIGKVEKTLMVHN